MAKTKKQLLVREPIKIRFKELADGQQSIYLDTYKDGKRAYEFLRIYLRPTDTAAKKQEALALAESIRQKRLQELQAPEGFIPSHKKKISLYTFIENYITAETAKGSSSKKLYYHIKLFTKNTDCRLTAVNAAFVEKFEKYLKGSLKQNSVATYMAKFKHILNKAAQQNIISHNLLSVIKVKREQTHIEFLTAAELQQLADTPAPEPIRNAFLFCCLTGLRYSDCANLKWSYIYTDAGKYSISYRQKKTGKEELLPISGQAALLMGERPATDGFVFESIPTDRSANYYLKKWIAAAGITKNIHWHCSRHTFATLTINNGAEIYTTQKLLGHSTSKQTETYAKLLDKTKREAVEMLPSINL